MGKRKHHANSQKQNKKSNLSEEKWESLSVSFRMRIHHWHLYKNKNLSKR
ncbi:hypothetical protein LEP1GSC017_2688 [Leptospira meyeri serovar Hardjo str. Went 5]|nr:hypothetical protein LEP1GSC017_2688 [Leptospira meyeri serovar Hardjo str. Went 5]